MEQALPPRPRNPTLLRLHKFRVIILPIVLISVFTTLILGAIYAYCVAKPHTDIADQLALDSNAHADSSIFGKRETTTSGSGSGSELALLFYTLTVPGLSILHNAFELIMHHNTPRLLTLRSIYITFLATSSLLVCGWITNLAFWMHCELPIFNQNIPGQRICPAQVRGHFMYGIHEVSITRIVVGWTIVLVYMIHVVLLALGYRVQRRLWRITGEGKANETSHGEARVVVVRFEEEGRRDDRALSKEANVV
jgi:hypothetical protein